MSLPITKHLIPIVSYYWKEDAKYERFIIMIIMNAIERFDRAVQYLSSAEKYIAGSSATYH